MSKVPEAIEIFKKRMKFYKSIDLRIAAIRYENSWYNVRTRILLSHIKPTGLTRRVIDVGNFVIFFESLSADKFPDLLKDIDHDAVEVEGVKLNFFAEVQHNLTFESWYDKSSERAKERWNINWPLSVFKWSVQHKLQNEIFSIVENASLRLNTHDPAYENIYEVVREFLGLHEYLFREYQGRESECYILLPDYLTIENSILRGDRLDFEVKFHPLIDSNDLRLNLISRGRKVRRLQKKFTRKQVQKSGAFNSIKASLNLKDTSDVQMYLFQKSRESEGPSVRKDISNLKTAINPRFMANEIFGANTEKLKHWLHGLGKRKSDDFEHAVSILFHISGFSAEWLDRGNLGEDAPDILAFCSEPRALIVGECKTDVFGWKELRKLKTRAMQLCQELKIDTYPVMLTCLKQNDIDETTRKKAQSETMKILGSQELEEMLRIALRGGKPRDVLNRYFHYPLKRAPK